MSTGAIVAVAVSVAAVLGLLVGAVWGLAGGGSEGTPSAGGPTSPSTVAPAPSSPEATGSTPSSTPTRTSSSPTPAPAPTGEVPPAPATTTTSADGWRLGSWRITNTGTLGVDTTARNTSTGTRSADLVLYVYVDGRHIATTTARVTDVPAGGTVPVQFTGTDQWQPGQKVLLLQVP
jgi:cytoskeletal protein RodZ